MKKCIFIYFFLIHLNCFAARIEELPDHVIEKIFEFTQVDPSDNPNNYFSFFSFYFATQKNPHMTDEEKKILKNKSQQFFLEMTEKIIQPILRKKSDFNNKDKALIQRFGKVKMSNQETLLHQCVYLGNANLIKFIMEDENLIKSISVFSKNKDQKTAFMYAIELIKDLNSERKKFKSLSSSIEIQQKKESILECAQALLQSKIKMNLDDLKTSHAERKNLLSNRALTEDDLENFYQVLIQESLEKEETTLILKHFFHSHEKIITAFMQSNININFFHDNYGNNILQKTDLFSLDTILGALEIGADPNHPNIYGKTALFYLIEFPKTEKTSSFQIISALKPFMSYKAKLDHQDNKGKNIIFYCTEIEILKALYKINPNLFTATDETGHFASAYYSGKNKRDIYRNLIRFLKNSEKLNEENWEEQGEEDSLEINVRRQLF